MTARNDITGDSIVTKASSDAYRDNFDAIFGKKKDCKVDQFSSRMCEKGTKSCVVEHKDAK